MPWQVRGHRPRPSLSRTGVGDRGWDPSHSVFMTCVTDETAKVLSPNHMVLSPCRHRWGTGYQMEQAERLLEHSRTPSFTSVSSSSF